MREWNVEDFGAVQETSRRHLYLRETLHRVPALTLLNPWALAITRYGKRVENRTWPPPKGLERFFIHAGKGWDPDGLPFLRELGFSNALAHVIPSAIVAVAELDGVCELSTGKCGRCPHWAQLGRYHWRLRSVIPLATPVPCRGAQRLWTPPPPVVDAVAEALAALAWDPLVCRGRAVTGNGRALSEPHGLIYPPRPGETPVALESRARMNRWKVGPRPADGSMSDAMCPACANPTSNELVSIAALRGSA